MNQTCHVSASTTAKSSTTPVEDMYQVTQTGPKTLKIKPGHAVSKNIANLK